MFDPFLHSEESLVRIALFWMKMEDLGLRRPYSYAARLCAESALARGDREGAEILVLDNQPRHDNVRQISRFIPGKHYYALDRKFPTYDLAAKYILDRGFAVHPEMLEHRTPKDGD